MMSIKRLKRLMDEYGENTIIVVEGEEVFAFRRINDDHRDDNHDDFGEEGYSGQGYSGYESKMDFDGIGDVDGLSGEDSDYDQNEVDSNGEFLDPDQYMMDEMEGPPNEFSKEKDNDFEHVTDNNIPDPPPAMHIHDILEKHVPEFKEQSHVRAMETSEDDRENQVTYEEFPEDERRSWT